MRILHTSDWHLGKTLEGHSRLEEQQAFLDEVAEIIEERDVNLVIIAGDVYDSSNPPAWAERLFYSTLKRFSANAKRGVLVIAGNHDNPDRLEAASPLACEHGVILLGRPKSRAVKGKWGNVEVVDCGEGYVDIKINGEEAVIITLPYPSEKRLNEIISFEDDDKERRKSYAERIGEVFRKLSSHYREDTINLAVGHLFMVGGEESQSERPIQLGGTFAVEAARLPDAQYIALGHLHKPQKIQSSDKNAYYSGSPLQYSKSEITHSKCVYIVDVKAGQQARVEEMFLRNHKPIEIWRCEGIEDAIRMCRDNRDRNAWVYLEIKTDRNITQGDIKEMKSLKKDIVQIRPIFEDAQKQDEDEIEDYTQLNMDELFKAYYVSRRGVEPPEDVMNMFYKIMEEGEGEDETQIVENQGTK